ncbi:MAG: hypothetical protein AB8H86_21155 [Polyangiales bacterium]
MKGREEAAAVIWPALQDAATETDAGRAAKVRRSAVLRWAFGLGVAALAFFVFARPVLATIIASVSSFIFLLALVSPLGAHAFVDGLFARLAKLVGAVLSYALLGPVFYLFITPFGLLARRGERDTLKRRLDPERESYWQERDAEDASSSLEHPY